MSNLNSTKDNSSTQSDNEQESDQATPSGNCEEDLLKHIEQTLEGMKELVEDISSSCLITSITPSDTQIPVEHEDIPAAIADEIRHTLFETITFLQISNNDLGPDNFTEHRSLEEETVRKSDMLLNHQLGSSVPELLQDSSEILGDRCILPDKISVTGDEDLPIETEASCQQRTNNRYVEPTVSTLAREILLRGESCEMRRTKILQLPPDHTGTCGEREIVGDDAAQTATHIFCECERPGVAGGAVPVVTSFTMSAKDPDPNDNDKPKSDSKSSLTKKGSCSEINHTKPRSSLIPKLSSSFRNEKLDSVIRSDKSCPDSSTSADTKQPKNITFKKVFLPERRNSSSSSVKNNSYASIAKKGQQDHEDVKECSEDDRHARYKKLTHEFSKQISRLAQEASGLAEIKSSDAQSAAIDSLYSQIINLRKVANDLKVLQSRNVSETVILDQSLNVDETQSNAETNNKLKTKDNNRIYIKFLPTKTNVKKRKSCNSEVQTDFDYVLDQETFMPPNDELYPKEVDSVDGMFIPSSDDPPKMEDEDDEDGLDITITFPEFQNAVREDDSHLSVRFSSISAEALGRLKRCPKEFTLRMDFVQGKMFFQSGKSPANNFAIGPDLKITECIIDNKQSDIINIKPSTECLYASQIITVEGESARKNSIKILRSTDSELFNVVSLPYVNKRTSVATKSCITFKNLRRVSSESLLPERTYYKSMPQIPSLTRILEEPSAEYVVGGIRTATSNNEKRPRNRPLQKKRTNASLENIINDSL